MEKEKAVLKGLKKPTYLLEDVPAVSPIHTRHHGKLTLRGTTCQGGVWITRPYVFAGLHR